VLEVKDPGGNSAGETESIAPGAVGEVVIAMATAGTWKLVIEGDGAPKLTGDLTVA
jgi:uncharacterized cupredoxin-like copper-binding protein